MVRYVVSSIYQDHFIGVSLCTWHFIGLKAVFHELQLTAPGCYMASTFGRTVKIPVDDRRSHIFMTDGLEQLFAYKDFVVGEAEKLNNALLDDRGDFGSQSTVEEQNFLKNPYIISEKANIFPQLPDDIYNSP